MVVALGCLLALPAAARAQSAIAGVVRDASGAVLPGVTVEASSEALIERTRSVVTNGQGQYTIVDLRPGVYDLSFTLEGFSLFKRTGIELPANFTATINAELKVGALEESVTVTGQSPVVDVQSSARTTVLSRDVLDTIPTGRTIQSVGQLVVGVTLNVPDVGGSRAMQQTYMSVHGLSSSQVVTQVDGMMVNGLDGDGAVQNYFNNMMSQEMSYQTAGAATDVSGGGVRLNMIPKEGGNRYSGAFFGAWSDGAWQSNNLTQTLQDRGLSVPDRISKIYDFNGSFGGAPMGRRRADRRHVLHAGRVELLLDVSVVHLEGDSVRAGDRRPAHQERAAPPHLAGVSAKQAGRVLRQSGQRSRPRHERRRRSSDGIPDLDLARLQHGIGEVDVDRHQPAARRRRLLVQHRALQHREPAGHRSAARHRCVVCGREPSRSESRHALGLSRSGPGPVSGPIQRAGIRVVCDRHAQHQGGRAVELGSVSSNARRKRRSGATLSQWGSRFSAGVQHAD
jgi:hypothetical protein